ncbi:hypothetical protein HMP06_0436 [Sphingomonas sp. HMP6]|nr:hypothetical protein HMP06_0436 [Sphingomonas sp. HMP6]
MQRLAEASAAVERGNNRAGGNKLADRCIRTLYETGKPGEGCPPVTP